MTNYKFIIGAVAGSMLLASCQSNRAVAPEIAIAPTPKPVEVVKVEPAKPKLSINGRWRPADPKTRHVYVNEFHNGVFVGRLTNSTDRFAEGSYKIRPSGQIDLKWYSANNKTNKSATCRKLSKNEIQCTSSGNVFNLERVS